MYTNRLVVRLAAIAFGFVAVKQKSKVFNCCVEEVILKTRPMPRQSASATAATERYFLSVTGDFLLLRQEMRSETHQSRN